MFYALFFVGRPLFMRCSNRLQQNKWISAITHRFGKHKRTNRLWFHSVQHSGRRKQEKSAVTLINIELNEAYWMAAATTLPPLKYANILCAQFKLASWNYYQIPSIDSDELMKKSHFHLSLARSLPAFFRFFFALLLSTNDCNHGFFLAVCSVLFFV